ncbi:hypothetical protein OXX80_007957 [Metschnikowia pulcherrima]
MPASVFVSGATGFIAQHIIKLLLSKGYRVVGSVRSSEKGKHLVNTFGAKDAFTYEVVPSLEPEGAFDDALRKHPEVTVFLHTASPVNLAAEDVEEELLKPAVKGTKNVFRAIKHYGPQIKHVVVTSSVAAQFDYSRMQDPTHNVSEDSWNSITWEDSKANPFFGYMASKKFAEKAAWEFVEQEKPNFVLNVINPVYVLGPQAYDTEVKAELNFTAETVNKLLSLTPESELPEFDTPFVDVRDVARAHVAAFEDNFENQRLLLSTSAFTTQILVDILNANLESLRGKLPVGKPRSKEEPKCFKVNNEKTRKLLGFSFIDLKTSVVDSASQILEVRGAVESPA